MRKIKAVIYGVGALGQLTARVMLERGIDIVGAIGNKSNVGRDLGEVIGAAAPLGVTISNDADQVLRTAQADIAVLTVGATMDAVVPHLERCIIHGTHVLSLCDEMFYPWQTAPRAAAAIDALAKRHRVTVSAGGMQDVFWVGLATTLSGASQRISSIKGQQTANVDEYGPALAQHHCIGEALSTFSAIQNDGLSRANVFTVALQALAAELGLRVVEWSQQMRPLAATAPVESRALGRTIEPGQVLGAVTASRMTTQEGIELSGEIHLKVFDASDRTVCRWTITGEPLLQVECLDVPSPLGACTTIINRIPDILAAPHGLVTVEALPKPKYKSLRNSS